MSERNSTCTQIHSVVTASYEALQKHIDFISKRFQAKNVIKQNFYNDIMKSLFILKGIVAREIYFGKRSIPC